MLSDLGLKQHHAIESGFADLDALTPVDDGLGHMEQEIYDSRLGGSRGSFEKPIEKLAGLGPYAGQARGRCEKRIEERRPHRLIEFSEEPCCVTGRIICFFQSLFQQA
jgi:hypothetical protein